ncbi:MAG: hypothetical protein V1875_07625 [Candidatus Altiarchaeota archaeon]
MMSVVGGIRQSAQQMKEWFLKEFVRQQEKELGGKIDQMLKSPRIMVKFFQGASIGGRTGRSGLGRSIGKGLRMLRKLL